MAKRNESHVHHYVPRSVLRRFAPDAKRSYVHVFDKTSGASWKGGLTGAGSTKGYNTLTRPDGSRLNFETDFDDLDADYALVGDELARRRSLADLDDAFLFRLADAAVVQFLRTPIVRSTLDALPRDLVAQLRAKGFDAPDDSELPGDDAVRQSTRDLIARRDQLRFHLLAKDIMLFEPGEAARFWISDHPVARFSRLPLGETGFESLGVEIYLPLAADLTVGFVCPSLRADPVRAFVEGELRDIPVEQVLAEGAPLRVPDPVVNFFNSQQVTSGQRFLFASSGEFTLARQMLAQWPSLADKAVLMRAGEMGMAPPRPTNLPPGEWLYLEHGAGYVLIPIHDYGRGDGHEMSTDRPDLLAAALKEGVFDRADVFAKHGGGGMRNVVIDIIAHGPPVRFRLAFADPSMRTLDRLIRDQSV